MRREFDGRVRDFVGASAWNLMWRRPHQSFMRHSYTPVRTDAKLYISQQRQHLRMRSHEMGSQPKDLGLQPARGPQGTNLLQFELLKCGFLHQRKAVESNRARFLES